MVAELAISGGCCAIGLTWAMQVAKEQGWDLFHPMKNWDKKLDVLLGIMTVAVTLYAGPTKGIMMTFLSLSFSIIIRIQKWYASR